MNTRTWTTTTALSAALALALTACGSSQAKTTESASGASTDAKSETPAKVAASKGDAPSLAVPDRAEGGKAKVKIDPGNLPEGAEIGVYAYPMGWSGGGAPNCSSSEPKAGSITVDKTGGPENLDVSVDLGKTSIVLSAPGYATKCGAKGSVVTSKLDASDVTVETPEDAKTGESVPLKIYGPDEGEGTTVDVRLTFLGPYDSVPDAAAAKCSTAPAAGSSTVHVDALTRENDALSTSVTAPKKQGVYMVQETIPETGRVSTSDTCRPGASLPTLTVAGK